MGGSIPHGIVRSLIAMSSQKDELRFHCLESLRMLLLKRPLTVAECDGIKPLFDAIIDPNAAVSVSCLGAPCLSSQE